MKLILLTEMNYQFIIECVWINSVQFCIDIHNIFHFSLGAVKPILSVHVWNVLKRNVDNGQNIYIEHKYKSRCHEKNISK